MLKPAFGKTAIICVDDLSGVRDSIKMTLRHIAHFRERIERELSAEIYFLVSDRSSDYCHSLLNDSLAIKEFVLTPYTKDDILEYLRKKHNNALVCGEFSKKIDSIEKICSGNLNLADFIFASTLYPNDTYIDVLENIVNKRIDELNETGRKQNLSPNDIENIILSSALSAKTFTKNELQFITQHDEKTIESSLNLAKDAILIDEKTVSIYDFHCHEIKNTLKIKSLEKFRCHLLGYYNYYVEHEPDEYFLRAYYLLMFDNELTTQAASLLALSIIHGMKMKDFDITNKVTKLIFRVCHISPPELVKQIDNFCLLISDKNATPDDVMLLYNSIIHLKDVELPLIAEITRLCFSFFYIRHIQNKNTIDLLNRCYEYIRNELCFSKNCSYPKIKIFDESVIRINIGYTIMPYVLDICNNINAFNEINEICSKLINCCHSYYSTGAAQYAENVFNRKAFLYVNPMQCFAYYDKAEQYFRENEIWNQLCMTLACRGGTDIVTGQYANSIKASSDALSIATEHNILIPQPQKINNNLLIADFLEFEQSHSYAEILAKALQTMKALRGLLNGKKCETEYVIITNICSLSLYLSDDASYCNFKEKIQQIKDCSDIADISDNSIDDFYRYYFSCFEIYRNINRYEWLEAEKKCHQLENFVPSLFSRQEVFWKMKHKALAELISERHQMNPYDFCINLVKHDLRETALSKFFLRGLMLSDLQYTSYD